MSAQCVMLSTAIWSWHCQHMITWASLPTCPRACGRSPCSCRHTRAAAARRHENEDKRKPQQGLERAWTSAGWDKTIFYAHSSMVMKFHYHCKKKSRLISEANGRSSECGADPSALVYNGSWTSHDAGEHGPLRFGDWSICFPPAHINKSKAPRLDCCTRKVDPVMLHFTFFVSTFFRN